MGFFNKLADVLGLVETDDDESYDYQQPTAHSNDVSNFSDSYTSATSNANSFRTAFTNPVGAETSAMPQPSVDMEQQYNSYGAKPTFKSTPKVTTFNSSDQIKMIVINPENYDEAREICDYIRTKKPVVVNLESMDFEIAQRVMDFLCGSCYSLNGNIQRVAKNIFIVAPDNIDVTSDYKSEIKGKNNSLSWMSFNKQNANGTMNQMPSSSSPMGGSSPFGVSRV